MSLLAEALKKSQKTGVASGPVVSRTQSAPSAAVSLGRIVAVCALLAVVAYTALVSLTGQAPSPVEKSPAVPTQVSPAPKLEGIVWDPSGPMVILDGKPLKIGEGIAGWRVESIAEDRVGMRHGQESRVLTLPEPPAKK